MPNTRKSKRATRNGHGKKKGGGASATAGACPSCEVIQDLVRNGFLPSADETMPSAEWLDRGRSATARNTTSTATLKRSSASVRQYPQMRFVAFEQRHPWGRLFVPDPSLRARYILTERCVALAACPQCHSIPGEPCKSAQGYGAAVHYVRRFAAGRFRQEVVPDVIEQPGL